MLLQAQQSDMKFEHLTAVQGLSYNRVQCILQDRQGYMWFGTADGLNRYDGYTFRMFKNIPGDSSTIAINDIVCLFEDSEGFIWIGTSTSSFSRYDPRTETFKNYSLPAQKAYTHDFEEDEHKILWLATGNGLFSFDKKTNNLTYHITDDSGRENIHSILKDVNKDILWLSSETGIRKFNKKNGVVKCYSVPYPAFSDISAQITHNIIRDRNGNFWMSSSNAGIYQFDHVTEKYATYSLINNKDSSSFRGNIATQLMEDDDGKIWAGGEGLAIIDPSAKSILFYGINANDPSGIPGKVRAIAKDRSGIYWVGTERGIAKYDSKLYSFTTIKSNYPFTVQSANTIIEDNDHKFWVGDYTGLKSMDTAMGLYKSENSILGAQASMLFCSAKGSDGSIWFGSENCLFHLFKNDGNKNYLSSKILLPGDDQSNVTSVAVDVNGLIWAGTKKGELYCYNSSLKTFKSFGGPQDDESLFSSNTISCLYPVSADSLLIGKKGKGLFVLNTKNEKIDNITLHKDVSSVSMNYLSINSIYKDSKKNIWIATENAGLWQTNSTLSQFQNYTVKDRLQSMNITQIVEDAEGQIWLNTNLGLDVIDPVEKRLVHYTEQDGLSINESSYLIKNSTGGLIRIDPEGLHIFHSSSVKLNKQPPPVYINHMQILDKDILIYGDTAINLKYMKIMFRLSMLH